jgi:hypothetical protein
VRIRFIKNPVNIMATVGEEYDLPDQVARELIRDGYAVLAIVRGFEDMRSKQSPRKAVIR